MDDPSRLASLDVPLVTNLPPEDEAMDGKFHRSNGNSVAL